MKYQRHQIAYCDNGKMVNGIEYEPIGEVTSYQEFVDFLKEYFPQSKHRSVLFKNVEFVDLGGTVEVRTSLWRGPFNENPISFKFQSDHSKKIPTHQLLNAIIGCVAQSPFYFLRVEEGQIVIDKQMEAY